MNERATLEILALRAVETADRERTLWSDADRDWATRTAAEIVGSRADARAFVARRAALGVERLSERDRALPRALAALAWRPWVGVAIPLLALVAGFAADQVGSAGRINLLAPPVLGLLGWNVLVYAWLLVAALRPRTAGGAHEGPLRRAVARLAAGGARRAAGAGVPVLARAIGALAHQWAALSARLYAARAARVLHLAAAAFALGVIAGLYLRGLAFEYRATWESTFLTADEVRALLAIVLAPGRLVTGLAIPDAAHLAAIRSGPAVAGENAATWLHLLAATVAVVVIVPRLALAALDGIVERLRVRRLAVPMDEPYFSRLLRSFHEGPIVIRVVPYSLHVSDVARESVQRVLARAFGPVARLEFAGPVAYGDDDPPPPPGATPGGPSLALFGLAATPESEAHGAFAAAVAARAPAWPALAIVDESAFRARDVDDGRLEGRRRLWQDVLRARRVEPVFVDLRDPDLGAAEATIESAMGGAAT